MGIPTSYLNETIDELVFSYEGFPEVVKTADLILPDDYDISGEGISKV